MSSELKRTLCNELIENGLVSENDVIRHSYTRNRLDNGVENMSRTESREKLSPTLDTRCDCLGVVVKEPTPLQKEVGNQAMEKGLMKPYDIIDYTYSNARLGEIMSGHIRTKNSENNQIANTLTTNAENMGVCVPGKINVIGNYSPSGHDASRIVHPEGVAPTVKENHGTVTAVVELDVDEYIRSTNRDAKHQQELLQHSKGVCRTIPAGTHGSTPHLLKTVVDDCPLRIRKLTPKECWRLMGFDDNDFAKAEKVNSNSQLYKQAGNSIVVNVLMAIFKELFVTKQTRSEWLDDLLN